MAHREIRERLAVVRAVRQVEDEDGAAFRKRLPVERVRAHGRGMADIRDAQERPGERAFRERAAFRARRRDEKRLRARIQHGLARVAAPHAVCRRFQEVARKPLRRGRPGERKHLVHPLRRAFDRAPHARQESERADRIRERMRALHRRQVDERARHGHAHLVPRGPYVPAPEHEDGNLLAEERERIVARVEGVRVEVPRAQARRPLRVTVAHERVPVLERPVGADHRARLAAEDVRPAVAELGREDGHPPDAARELLSPDAPRPTARQLRREDAAVPVPLPVGVGVREVHVEVGDVEEGTAHDEVRLGFVVERGEKALHLQILAQEAQLLAVDFHLPLRVGHVLLVHEVQADERGVVHEGEARVGIDVRKEAAREELPVRERGGRLEERLLHRAQRARVGRKPRVRREERTARIAVRREVDAVRLHAVDEPVPAVERGGVERGGVGGALREELRVVLVRAHEVVAEARHLGRHARADVLVEERGVPGEVPAVEAGTHAGLPREGGAPVGAAREEAVLARRGVLQEGEVER